MLAAFWVITTLGLFILREFGVNDDWSTRWYLFVFQPWRMPLYVGYYPLPIADESASPPVFIWLALCYISA